MQTLKLGLEKPGFIWILIAIVYGALFWSFAHQAPLGDAEQASLQIVEQFAQSNFPPKIRLVREVGDWGHLAYYAIYGRLYNLVAGDLGGLRLASLGLVLAALFLFARLGHHFTYRNRLSPVWISLALVLLGANPYVWAAASRVGGDGLLLLSLFVAAYLFEKDRILGSALFLSFAVLVDWHALLLAVAFVITRATGERSRLLRPERLLAFLLPFVVGALPLMAWNGLTPEGQVREWMALLSERAPVVRPDGLFYSMALLPLYAPVFAWAWGLRARSRALVLGAIWTAVLIPLYFLFPIRFDLLAEARGMNEVPLGLVDHGALLLAGPYKNLVLFVPWFFGAFLFMQLLLMDVLDRSRWLRYFILLFFATRPFVIGVGDLQFLIIVPFIVLLSLSEAFVGEEGKLA